MSTLPAIAPTAGAAPAAKPSFNSPFAALRYMLKKKADEKKAAGAQPLPSPGTTQPMVPAVMPRIAPPTYAPGTGGPAPLGGMLPPITSGYRPTGGGASFSGYFAKGGRMRPGQWGIVGEEGLEEVRVLPDGTTEIVPLTDDFTEDGRVAKVAAEQLPLGTSVTPQPMLPPIAPPGAMPPVVDEQAAGALPAIAPGLREQLAALDAKDYSIKKDDAGNVTHRGKDRDKKWSLWDKIASFATGWATGGLAGGIGAATDRNYFEKMGDENKRARILPAIAAEQQTQKFDSDQEFRRAQTETIGNDDRRMTAEVERKKAKDEATTKYWKRKADQGDLKLAQNAELMELRDKWANSTDVRDKRRLDLVEAEMKNRMERSDADRNSRERVAGMREAGATGRAQLQALARQALAEYNAAVRDGQQDKAIAARERLAQLKAEADAQPK